MVMIKWLNQPTVKIISIPKNDNANDWSNWRGLTHNPPTSLSIIYGNDPNDSITSGFDHQIGNKFYSLHHRNWDRNEEIHHWEPTKHVWNGTQEAWPSKDKKLGLKMFLPLLCTHTAQLYFLWKHCQVVKEKCVVCIYYLYRKVSPLC